MVRFWDASAIIPLLVHEPTTERLLALLREDEHMIVWWGTQVECISALARRTREAGINRDEEMRARTLLRLFVTGWSEIQPTDPVRSIAERLLTVHPLRGADALQLASAIVWSAGTRQGHGFVCLDDRLRDAALKEGYMVQPSY